MRLHQQIHNGMPALRNAASALLFILLHGCASQQAVKTDLPQPAQAVQTAPAAVAIAVPATVKADFDAAMAMAKAEEYEKSIVLFDKIIREMPNNAVPLINLALIYKKLGKPDLAEKNLVLALNAEPDNPVAHNEYAMLYRKTGRFAEARQLYETTLNKYPNFYMAHKNLGILCDLYLRDHACAMKHYGIYSNAIPDDKNVKIWIADLQNRMRQ